jgi:uncharacterized protein (DUF1800 family)
MQLWPVLSEEPMQRTHRQLVAAALLLSCASAGLIAAEKHKKAAAGQMDEARRALHVLNRFTFGPRTGDVDRVAAIGVDKWFEQQLHPEKIDDSALQSRLSGFRTLTMDARALVENYPPPQVLQAVANGRMPLPNDPQKRAVYEDAVERYRIRNEKKADGQANAAADIDPNTPPEEMTDSQREQLRATRQEARARIDQVLALPPDQRMPAIYKMTPPERLSLAQVLNTQERERLLSDFTPEQREQITALVNPQGVVVTELQQAKILRAAYSERQLDEVMTDFWFNHFNVFLNKGADRFLTTAYERDAIRAHALGKFKDLLVATAKSPAMLFYLDNWQSVGPHSFAAERGPRAGNGQFRQQRRALGKQAGFPNFPGMPQNRAQRRFPQQPPVSSEQPAANSQQPPQQQRRAGLNENYGRELMELHTLGVDGGYTQKDVTEAAKVFTGWTIKNPRLGGEFTYNDRFHEPGSKVVLGHEIKDNGEDEGLQLLDILAHSPATARFISKKLAMRFVSDDPPQALVNRMADTFLKTDGDIREVLRTMFRAPEFWAPETYRAKVKTPFEFVVSAIRATGVDVQNAMPFVQTLNQLGMPLYQMQPPTGYSMKAEAWVNSAALLGRMNFALRLAAGRMPGVSFDPALLLAGAPASGDAQQNLAVMESKLLAGDISKQTHDTILKQLQNPEAITQQLNQATARPMQQAPDKEEFSMAPNLRGRRQQNAPGFTGPPPSKDNLIAGLLLGSPEFQRR